MLEIIIPRPAGTLLLEDLGEGTFFMIADSDDCIYFSLDEADGEGLLCTDMDGTIRRFSPDTEVIELLQKEPLELEFVRR